MRCLTCLSTGLAVSAKNLVYLDAFQRYACITYDGFKDLFKLYIDGVKVTSGPFSGDDPIAVVR